MQPKELLKAYPFAIGMAATSLVLAGLVFWRSSLASEVTQQLQSREAESNRLAENIRAGQKLDEHLQRLVELASDVQSRLTDPTDIAANQQYFYSIEADTGTKITDLRKMASVERPRGAAGKAYGVVPYSVVVQGDYASIMRFVRKLEDGPKLMRIAEATFAVTSAQQAGEPSKRTLVNLSIKVEFLSKL